MIMTHAIDANTILQNANTGPGSFDDLAMVLLNDNPVIDARTIRTPRTWDDRRRLALTGPVSLRVVTA